MRPKKKNAPFVTFHLFCEWTLGFHATEDKNDLIFGFSCLSSFSLCSWLLLLWSVLHCRGSLKSLFGSFKWFVFFTQTRLVYSRWHWRCTYSLQLSSDIHLTKRKVFVPHKPQCIVPVFFVTDQHVFLFCTQGNENRDMHLPHFTPMPICRVCYSTVVITE